MNPIHMRDLLGVSTIVAASLESGLLEALMDGPATSAALASKLGLDPRATPLALELLVTVGFAEREGDTYAAAPDFAMESLRGPGGAEMVFSLWRHAKDFLRTGRPFVRMDASPAERDVAYKDVVAGLGRMYKGPAKDLATRVCERISRRSFENKAGALGLMERCSTTSTRSRAGATRRISGAASMRSTWP